MAGARGGRAAAAAAASWGRLERLERRVARAERQLRAVLALRGRLRALERWLQAGGGREAAGRGARRVPGRLAGVWVRFTEREWRALQGWQRALRRAVLPSRRRRLRPPLPPGKGPGPAGGEGCRRDAGPKRRPPAAPRPPPAEERDARGGGGKEVDGDSRGDPGDTGTEDSTIRVKQEEELGAGDQQEGEAGEAPAEPCPQQIFYKSEAWSGSERGEEAGEKGEDPPRDSVGEDFVAKAPPAASLPAFSLPWELPASSRPVSPSRANSPRPAGSEPCANDVLLWIKQEEEPRSPERRHLEEEEISPDPSLGHDEDVKRDAPADCFQSAGGDSEVPGRCEEKFSQDPSPGVRWGDGWNSEMTGTNSAANGLGRDAGFGEHLHFFSAPARRPRACDEGERSSSGREHPQPPRGGEMFPAPACEKNLNEKLLQGLPGARDVGLGAAHARTKRARSAAGGPGDPERDGASGEVQPAAESENFTGEKLPAFPCWDQPPDNPGGASASRQQGRGKSYICGDCGKSFVCHSWFVRHRATHTGERPYKCSECDKSYGRKDYLLNHQRRHSGEGLFPCPLCRKRFVLQRSLAKHQESHIRETRGALGGWP